MLFKILPKNRLKEIREKNISEREIQNLIGENLEVLMNLKFVDFEFSIEKVRIDILAFDEELNSPVVIELKKDNSKSLFDQGMEYFHILLNRKSDFVLRLHEKLNLPANAKKINWENSRVVFIGKNFSTRQKRAVDFSGISIELWDYDFFENNFLKLEKVGLKKTAKLEISGGGGKSEKIEKITREFKEYDRDFHCKKASEKMWQLFEKIETELSRWENVEKKYRQFYIGFSKFGRNFADIHLKKKEIEIHFKNHDEKIDGVSQKMGVEKIPERYGWGKNLFRVKISDKKNLDNLFFILKKSYKFISENL